MTPANKPTASEALYLEIARARQRFAVPLTAAGMAGTLDLLQQWVRDVSRRVEELERLAVMTSRHLAAGEQLRVLDDTDRTGARRALLEWSDRNHG